MLRTSGAQNVAKKKERKKVHEVYTQSGLSWSVVSIRTGASSYKWLLVQVSPIIRAFFVSFLELLRVYWCSVVP